MLLPYLIHTIFDFLLVAFLIWGIINEQKLIDFEKQIVAKWKARKSR